MRVVALMMCGNIAIHEIVCIINCVLLYINKTVHSSFLIQLAGYPASLGRGGREGPLLGFECWQVQNAPIKRRNVRGHTHSLTHN